MLVIVAGGSSVQEGINTGLWTEIGCQEIWALNDVVLHMPFAPNKLVWLDKDFYEDNREKILSLANTSLITQENTLYNGTRVRTYPIHQNYCRLCNRPEVYKGKTNLVGFFAVDLAIKQMYNNIYLLGYDFGAIDGQIHFYGQGDERVYENQSRIIDDFQIFKQFKRNITLVGSTNCTGYRNITYKEFYEESLRGRRGIES